MFRREHLQNFQKIPRDMYHNFQMNYYTTDWRMHLRFGQAFLRHFFPTLADDELFYEEDNNKAEEIIYEYYRQLEEK